MTDNNNHLDEFEQHELGQEPESEGRRGSGIRANLTHAWRSQPIVKLLVLIVAVAAIILVVLSIFSSSNDVRKNNTAMSTPPGLHEAPGGQATEMVKQQTMLANQEREKDALNHGGSAMPTPLGGDSEPKQGDALNELKAQIDSLKQEVARPRPAPAAAQQQPVQQVQQPEQFDEGLARAMQKQMGELATSWNAKGLKSVMIKTTAIGSSASRGGTAANGSGANGSGANAGSSYSSVQLAPKILIPAGTINYAKLLTQANSDVPGPILAEIVSGPLSGARAIGHFQVENAYADYLVLRFNLAELKGKEYSINTLAIDPDTSLGAMATDVDERYFERVFLPAAAAFVQGVGSALSYPGSTTTENGTATIVSEGSHGFTQGMYEGAAQAAQTVGQFFQNQANNTKPLIVVAAGTPMGLLFVTSLTDQPPPAGTSLNSRGQAVPTYGMAGYSSPDPSMQGSSYPGTTVSGYGNSASNVPYPPSTGYSSASYNPAAYSSFLPGYNASAVGYPH